MKSICFFSHFHNGDIFHIKSFLEDIISNLETEYYIAHPNNKVLTCDMNMEYINIPIFWAKSQDVLEETRKRHEHHVNLLIGKEHTKFIDTPDCFYINTWIGGYFSPDNEYNGECSLRGFHKMFSNIYNEINNVFNVNLNIKSVGDYYPFVDYSKLDCSAIDKFIVENEGERILICNGPALSGQTTYNSDMSEIIEPLAVQYPTKIFIASKKFNTSIKNIKFTDDIIGLDSCDLNEISYLSKFCYLIVGRNSGPFCFTLTKENINDKGKKFLAYGSRETDCLPYGNDIESTFIFDYFNTIDQLSQSISELI
jgi:hypothetical protein